MGVVGVYAHSGFASQLRNMAFQESTTWRVNSKQGCFLFGMGVRHLLIPLHRSLQIQTLEKDCLRSSQDLPFLAHLARQEA